MVVLLAVPLAIHWAAERWVVPRLTRAPRVWWVARGAAWAVVVVIILRMEVVGAVPSNEARPQLGNPLKHVYRIVNNL